MISIRDFGKLSDGVNVTAITLDNGILNVTLLDYGARVQSVVFGGVDVVLGYDDAAGYEKCTAYQGATVGRFANRIDAGRFSLNGVEYDVGRNSGKVHLHGGDVGFDRAIWSYEATDGAEPAVIFTHVSPDGDMGYPGELRVSVAFTLSGGGLRIKYSAVSDKDTVISLTNHSYFNLDGEGDALGQYLKINASEITPLNDLCVPDGSFMNVEGTPFDFREFKRIGDGIDADDPQIRIGAGFDHNFVIDGEGMRAAACAFSEKSGICMECRTDRPGMQLYTSNFLGESEGTGKNEAPYFRRQAFCLETQGFPDAPNKPQFPSAVLKSGEEWESETVYAFSKK